MDKNKRFLLPVNFSVNGEYKTKDIRFLNVTIDVLHLGENFNGSVFTKEVVEQNIETIKNTPILGYIKENENGEKDFTGHEHEIVVENNIIKEVYLGQAYGVIPESCNARWVKKISSDGEEREYLQVDGLIWTKFNEAVDVFERDISKGQSMELEINNFDGTEDENGIFTFTKFSFAGCCILSTTDESIQPAMIDSNITLQFSVDNVFSEIKNRLEEFNKLKFDGGGKRNMEDIKNTNKENFTQTVQSAINDIANIVEDYETETNQWGDRFPRYYFRDVQGNEVIVEDRKDHWNFYGFTFKVENDKPIIDFSTGVRKKIIFENYQDGENTIDNSITENRISEFDKKIDILNQKKSEIVSKYETLQADYDKIKPKYDEYVLAEEKRINEQLEAEKENVFNEYSLALSDVVEFEQLKEKKSEMSVKDIESECAILFAKKNLRKNFSKRSDSLTVNVSDTSIHDDDDTNYVSTKYGNIPLHK